VIINSSVTTGITGRQQKISVQRKQAAISSG
jgi:hypothetical protein